VAPAPPSAGLVTRRHDDADDYHPLCSRVRQPCNGVVPRGRSSGPAWLSGCLAPFPEVDAHSLAHMLRGMPKRKAGARVNWPTTAFGVRRLVRETARQLPSRCSTVSSTCGRASAAPTSSWRATLRVGGGTAKVYRL